MKGKWEPKKMAVAGQTVYRVERITGLMAEGIPVIEFNGTLWATEEDAALFAVKLNAKERCSTGETR